MEYSQCHTQAISQFQNLFPSVNMPNIQPGNSLHQMLDVLSSLIQDLIKNLPRPTINEVNHTLTNMKSVIDHQELRIQRNMMEIEFESIGVEDKMMKKTSPKKCCSDNFW